MSSISKYPILNMYCSVSISRIIRNIKIKNFLVSSILKSIKKKYAKGVNAIKLPNIFLTKNLKPTSFCIKSLIIIYMFLNGIKFMSYIPIFLPK